MFNFYNIHGYLSLLASIFFICTYFWIKTLNLLGVVLFLFWINLFLLYTILLIPTIYFVWIQKSNPSPNLIANIGFLSYGGCIVWVLYLFVS